MTPEMKAMTERSKMPYEEQKRRGQAIYNAHIRHLLGAVPGGLVTITELATASQPETPC